VAAAWQAQCLLHALMDITHANLTHQGRDFRLTCVAGKTDLVATLVEP
jgi:hypothetical protein